MDDDTFNHIKNLLDEPKKAVLTLHKNPDPDSVASNLVMHEVLRVAGHYVDVFSEDPVPETFSFLDGFEKIQIQPMKDVDWESYSTFWALDMAGPDRNGFSGTYPKSLITINIDHHPTNPEYGAHNVVMKSHPSTTTVLYALYKKLHTLISPLMATALMTGLVSDTGCFKYAGNQTFFGWASEITALGADYDKIISHLYEDTHLDSFVLAGKVLARAEVHKGEKALIGYITEAERKKLDDPGEAKSILEGQLQSMHGLNWGALIIEQDKKTTRLSFRSKKGTDVSKIAQKFGGGGHVRAAGASIDRKPRKEVIKDILKVYKELR